MTNVSAGEQTILAIDPGSAQSAWLVCWRDSQIIDFGIEPNEVVLRSARYRYEASVVVIEEIESYGMPVGREVFDTVRWSGRFEEACYPTPVVYLPRRAVKLHLCNSAKARDSNIRAALLDKIGPQGTKAAPGPTYGISKDVWSALALAVTYSETR